MKAVPAYARPRGYKPGQLLTITIALSSILGLVVACLQLHPAYSHASSQKLIWSDEFNGPAGKIPDASKWSPDVSGSGWGNNQREYDTKNKNAYQDGHGDLVLEARKENPANYHCWYGPCQYTSARINTGGHFKFTYGRVEARIKIPYGQGLWPAFWLLGDNVGSVGWPNSGEMDIMENIGSREPNTIHGTVHGPNYSGTNGIGGPDKLPRGRFADTYHIYAVAWDTSHISFSLDGISYFTVTRATIEKHGKWVFDHPFFIILNSAVGGFWPGNPNSSNVFPQKMSVDYVRVYQ